jgi:outer membrane receptor for ferrienterochelin and colicins
MKKLCIITILMITVGQYLGSVARAQESSGEPMTVEKTVVTATMTPKEINDAPGSIEVITSLEIKAMGAETVAEALTEAVGLDLDHVAGRGMIPQIRGLTNKRTLVLIDGMRFATGFRDTTVDLTEMSIEIIDRIEIVRGPSSALYGSEAIGGVINLITKAPPAEPGGDAGIRYGQNTYGDANNYIAKGALGNTFGKFGILMAAQANITDKFDRYRDDHFTDIDDEERYMGMVKLTFNPTAEHRFTAGATYQDITREGLRPKNKTVTDREVNNDRTDLFLQYDGNIFDTAFMLRGYYSKFDLWRDYTDIGHLNPKNKFTYEEFDIENELYQLEARASRLFGQHLVTLGAEYREEERSGVENRGESDFNKTIDNKAIFLQDDFPLFEHLLVTVGVRFDDQSDFGSEFSPRLSLVYKILDNLRLKASYGEGFRAPSVYELYVETINMGGDVIPNPDLDQETSRSYEIGMEGEYGPLTGKIMFFRNDLENMITKVQVGSRITTQGGKQKKIPIFEMRNVDEAYTQGVELEAEITLPYHLSLAGNTTFIDSHNDETDDDLLEVPEIKSMLRLAYDNSELGLTGNLRMNYTGKQLLSKKLEGKGDKAGGYTLWHIYGAKTILDNFEIFAGVDNLFNKKFSHYANRGMFWYTGLTASF